VTPALKSKISVGKIYNASSSSPHPGQKEQNQSLSAVFTHLSIQLIQLITTRGQQLTDITFSNSLCKNI